MNKQKLKGLWIPLEILLDEQLSDKEKLILLMILYLFKYLSKFSQYRRWVRIVKI